MQVQIFVDGSLIDIKVVDVRMLGAKPDIHEAKKFALKASLNDRTISISGALKATFVVFGPDGKPINEMVAGA